MTVVCPHCGFDLRLDTPVLINDFSMLSPSDDLHWMGRGAGLTASERTMMFALMKCYPQPVATDVLLDRMDSEGSHNTIAVFATRIRNKLRALGAPIPFRPARGNGRRLYQWLP